MEDQGNILDVFIERRSYFLELLLEHLYISAFAVVIIGIVGISAGILILQRPGLRRVILSAINFLYTIPSIAMFGIFIPLVGIGFYNAVIVLFIYGLLPVIRNTYTGLSEVDKHVLEAGKATGATPGQIFHHIRLPLAMPTIISGLRIMVVMTIALAGLASFIGAGGLGQAIYRGINTNNPNLIIAGSLSVAFLALYVDWIMGVWQRFSTRRRPERKKTGILLIILLLITLLLLAAGIITTHEKTATARLVVASKPTSEQYILGEMAALLIEENTGLSVERKFGMGGGASAIHPAIVSKEIHIYPEYSGTAWLYVLKKPTETARSDFFPELEEVYRDSFGLLWTGRLGFNNTFTLALPEETAREFDIETYSDLATYSHKLIFGAEFDFFEREDGYPGLLNYYDFRFKKIEELDINLKYEALKNERVDVINAFSTDSRIRAFNLRVLEDDKDFFPEYEAGYVINESTAKEYPEVMEWLERLSGRISNTDMTALNYRVEIENQTTQNVARDFLIKQGLINEKGE